MCSSDPLRIAPLLAGYRGRPAADRRAIVDCVLKLAALVEAQADELLEVDINPLIVGSEGVTVADALLVYRQTEDELATSEGAKR